ncbi:MAG: undecaprenyldiphospho-muramoylpentapeptide beta-N-acetylglucosaminyltransferase [Chloroflexi bacterium]|nr:MAG: undecaprenyldiphospho-muramoylpentapeptide beta-N-acetylglucosaminyltransferase [Chloroflexota bacterium]
MRALISGGGTGGHLFPAIAVAQALSRKDPDARVLFVGRRGGMEENVVPSYGIPFATIAAVKLDMEAPLRNWSVPFLLPRALWEAAALIRRFRPDVVLGTGGYVSGPLILTAAVGRVPIVLQEQNYLPGRTTRLLARFATEVATAYPETARYLRAKTAVTGTPVRSEFWRPRTDFPDHPRRLLVLGGSQGAHRINEAVAAALPQLLSRPDFSVAHQTGDRDISMLEGVKAGLPEGVRNRYDPFAFSPELSERIRAADLILSRAGASTLSEVSAVGVPMLLVPGPFAGGHQRLNAEPFERAGAAIIIPNESCDGETLVRDLAAIIDQPERYRNMVDAMRQLGRPYAAEEVAQMLIELARPARPAGALP